jgi:uncharacterized protein
MPRPCPPEAQVVESVRFAAGPYRLEGELAYPDARPPRGTAVIAGPHPLLGGTMHNNVVRGLGDGLAERGLATLRFNYRGVGNSQGPPVDVASHFARFWQTSHSPDELDLRADVDAAVAFARGLVAPKLPLVLIGYSFGCALLPLTRLFGDMAALVLVAPTVGNHDYEAYLSLKKPTLVIAPEGDFAADAGCLRAWFDRLAAPRQLVQAPLDGHFFRAYESWVVEAVLAFLGSMETIGDGFNP